MITLNELMSLPGLKGTFGEAPHPESVLTFSTDTRSIEAGQAFIAIDGQRFRPLEFLGQLRECPVIIYTKNDKNDELARNAGSPAFFVGFEDSVTALQAVGRAIAEKFVKNGGKILAISGSNGKTTTKEMLYHLVSSVDRNTVCTQKNNNNHIGVPLSLLQIRQETNYCILELGSNHPGEIEVLCDIARPNYGITTNIGDTHLEFFQNRENVFLEEGFLYHSVAASCDEQKTFFLNKDDEYLSRLEQKAFTRTFGKDSQNDIVIDVGPDKAQLKLGAKSVELENKAVTGEHNFQNLAVAFALAKHLTDADDKALLSAANSFRPTKNRSEWIKFGSGMVFLDAYNANPSSMKAAIKGFKSKCEADGISLSETALVLGDMNELGQNTSAYHEELGHFCRELGFENLFFVGRFSESYNAGCGGLGVVASDAQELKSTHGKSLLASSRLFIKGSRSLQLESIVDIS